jgi:hypothetical protein
VKLAATHQDAAKLDQLARITAEAVGLGVDDEEFRARDLLVEELQATCDTPALGRDAIGRSRPRQPVS